MSGERIKRKKQEKVTGEGAGGRFRMEKKEEGAGFVVKTWCMRTDKTEGE